MPPIYSMPDGTLWTADKTGYLTGEYVYTNHQVIWNALTFIYEGQKKFGLELLRKNLALSYLTWGYMWDGPNGCSAGGDTGEVNYGWDYWFNWSIWNAPAALLNKDITALTQPGGLVHRVLEAGSRQPGTKMELNARGQRRIPSLRLKCVSSRLKCSTSPLGHRTSTGFFPARHGLT